MLRQRDDSHAETAMIRAMLDATGRLAALGRQASDVALWCRPAPLEGEVTMATLAGKTAALATSGSVTATLDERAGLDTVSTSDPDALAAALAALAESTARDAGRPVRLSGRSDSGHPTFTLLLIPDQATAADPPAAPNPPTAVAFDRGGFGLSLVLASYVLDAHGADVRAAADGRGGVEVRLQIAGGSK
jgi:hypothetical protein